MSDLSRLRARLSGLRRRRWRGRVAAGLSGLLIGLLSVMAAAMLLDWLLLMSLAQRVIALGLIAAAALWVFWRFTLPWLRQRENFLDLALLVQRQEHIDSDLVAALQFESAEARSWGSAELRQEVIDRVADVGRVIDVERDAPGPQLLRRMTLLAAAVALWVVVLGLFPDYVTIFFKRLLLSSEHYPSRTAITAAAINGRTVDLAHPGKFPLRVAAGGPLRFAVTCEGRLPEVAEARLSSGPHGPMTLVQLAPDTPQSGVYHDDPQKPLRLNESVECQFFCGDSWTEPVRLTVVAPPVAELQMQVVPPSYTGMQTAWMPAGLRQVSVIEGSKVVVYLKSPKPLSSAWLTIGEKKYALQKDATPAAPATGRWLLDAHDSPLAAVVAETQFSCDLTDEDDMHLEQPVQGLVRLQPDQPPHVAAEIVTPYVLPTAKPTVYYRALDDFGLARISIVCQVTHADGTVADDEVPVYHLESEKALRRDIEARYPLELARLKLVKGDELKITVKAVDYRGPREGQATLSEPRVFHVTDQQGILAIMMESDHKSAEQLQAMIQRQLGIGGGP